MSDVDLSRLVAGIEVAHPGDTVIVVVRPDREPYGAREIADVTDFMERHFCDKGIDWIIFEGADIIIAKSGDTAPPAV